MAKKGLNITPPEVRSDFCVVGDRCGFSFFPAVHDLNVGHHVYSLVQQLGHRYCGVTVVGSAAADITPQNPGDPDHLNVRRKSITTNSPTV